MLTISIIMTTTKKAGDCKNNNEISMYRVYLIYL